MDHQLFFIALPVDVQVQPHFSPLPTVVLYDDVQQLRGHGQKVQVYLLRRQVLLRYLTYIDIIMSFKGVIELVVSLENYHIIEYPHQGLFSFHVRVYQLGQRQVKNYAIPYQILTKPKGEIDRSSRLILQPRIDDERAVSSKGLARYSDQTITLQDMVQFRLQVQGFPELQSQQIFLQIQFYFNQASLSEPEKDGELKQSILFKLNDLESGVLSYCQGEFMSPYLSRLQFTLFASLTSFKFAKYIPARESSSLQRVRGKVNTVQQLLGWAKQQMPSENIEKLFFINYVKKLRIGQYLLGDRVRQIRSEPMPMRISLDESYKVAKQCKQVGEKQLKDYLDNYIPQGLDMNLILRQLNVIREQNFDFMQNVLHEWLQGKFNMQQIQKQFKTYQRQKYGQRVFKSVVHGQQQVVSRKQLGYRQNKKIAKQIRGKNIIVNSYPLEDVRWEEGREQQQIVFYELTMPFATMEERVQWQLQLPGEDRKLLSEACELQYSEQHMLVVMCHGFQGSSYDMQLIKRWIQEQLPNAYYLVSRCNEDDTEGDIRKMGAKLAEDIDSYILNYMQEYQQQNVIINMVGHSMGGVIARAALPHLQKYNRQMGFFCSLSSPHLGYLNGVSGLVKVGLWAIRRWKKIESLQQLSMQESGDPRKTFLYELSRSGHLRHFRKVILLSSFQDSYVSWHSARISGHRSNNSQSQVQREMAENILGGGLFGGSVHRLDVNFNVKTTNLDSFIGRTAHINLIIRENLFKMLGVTLPRLFDLLQFGREGLFL